jgi:thymidylate kinase
MGSDGSGKTTIAEGLSKILSYPVEHHGPVLSYEEGYNEYFNCIKNTDYSVIKDRFHEGEKIYAPLYRGYEASYFPELEKALLEKFNVLLVLLQPPLQTVLDRIAVRGEDFVKPEHIEYCYDKITEIFNDSTLPKMIVDTSRHTTEENISKILKRIVI